MALKESGLRGSLRNVNVGAGIPDSGVSRYEFEQDYTDSWGDNGGAANGGPTFSTDSAVGTYALSLDGADDYAYMGALPITMDGSADFSYSAWFKVSDTSTNQCVFAPNYSHDWNCRINSGSIRWEYFDGSTVNSTTASVSADTYYHVVGTFSSADGLTLYLDGSAADTNAATNTPATKNDELTYGSKYTSTTGSDSPEQFLGGLIDDGRAYDKELSDSEVSSLYNNGSI